MFAGLFVIKGIEKMLVETLIAKAVEVQGTNKAVAELLGVSNSYLSDMKSGRRKIQPDDIAALAYLAGFNAINFLAIATLEQAKGTAKEKVLQQALGESIRPLEHMQIDGLRGQKGGLNNLYNVYYVKSLIRAFRGRFKYPALKLRLA